MNERIAARVPEERSIGELFSDLSRQTSTLVSQEIALARTEMTAQVRSAARGAGLIGAGGAVAYAGVLAVVAAAVLLLVEAGVAPWVSALLIGILVLILGGGLIAAGRSAIAAADLTPRRTIETIRDDATMAKEQLR